jgi:hypothetical protein
VNDDGDAHGQVGVDAVEEGQPDLGKPVESADHAGGGDGRSDHGQKNIRQKQDIEQLDAEGEKEDPIIKNNPQPDHKRKKRIEQEILPGPEKLQAADELLGQQDHPLGKPLRKRPEKKGDDPESLFPEKIKGEADEEESGGKGNADDPPEIQLGIAHGSGIEPRGVERPGQQKNAEEKAHGEHIENPLDHHRSDGEAGPDFFFLRQIEWLDQLPHPAGQGEVDGEPDRVSGKHAPEPDVPFLRKKEISPSPGARDQVERRQDDDQDKKRKMDLGKVPVDLPPVHAAEEEIEENARDNKDEDEADPAFSHDGASMVHQPLASVNERPGTRIFASKAPS